MRVWVDITNSPHVLFFRPLIRLLQADGHDVSITAREYAQTLELLELHGLAHEVVGPRHGGAGVLGKGARPRGTPPGAATLREVARLRPGARARLARADPRGAEPRHPQRNRPRLRVRHAPAPARPAGGDAGRLPGRDPGRPAGTAGCKAAEARPLPGNRGGVLPGRLRAGSGGARRDRSRRRCSRSCGRRRTSRSTTGTGTRSSPACSSGSAATSPCTRSSCLGRPSSARRFAASASPRYTSRSAQWTPRASSRWPISPSLPEGR